MDARMRMSDMSGSLAPAVAGEAAATATAVAARLGCVREHVHEPRVDGDSFAGRGGFKPPLQAFREPERDPGRERLVGGGLGGGAVVPHEHELRVAAGDPDFDAAVVELAR